MLSKFQKARKELCSTLIEREEEIELALVALVAGEHLLLVGPPGTAKSLLLESVSRFAGGNYFYWLMTKFTTPEEIFGMYDLPKLAQGEYIRKIKGKLPEADFAFLDEFFKSSSAILNAVLRILNEGLFDPGSGEIQVPLKACFAGSNEWPNEDNGQKELGALFDRFILRKEVKPIRSRPGRKKLLYSPDIDLVPGFSDPLTVKELNTVRNSLCDIPFSQDFKDAMGTCLETLRKEGVSPGDRRLRKSMKIVRATAWLDAQTEVLPSHGEILQHVLWDDPFEQPSKVRTVVTECFNPIGTSISKLLAEAQEIMDKLDHKNLGETLPACSKLQEIHKTLKGITKNSRAEAATQWVSDQIKEIKIKSLEV